MLIALFNFNDIGRFFPLEISNRLIPAPAFWGRVDPDGYKKSIDLIGQHVVLSLVVLMITWLICFRINKRRDL